MSSQSSTIQRKDQAAPEAEVPDGMLLRQSLAGDESAFEALVERYRRPLLIYIHNLLKDEDQAHDVLQFVLLRLYLCQPTLRTNAPLKAWLFQVASNRCVDVMRARRRRPTVHFSELYSEYEDMELIEAIPDPQPSPEELLEQRERSEVLQVAIQGLSPNLRGVVRLRCFGALSFSEIGHVLKMPENTVKTYFYRALPRLRSALSSNPALSLTA